MSAAAGENNLTEAYHTWIAPRYDADERTKLSWLNQSLSNGLNTLRAETAYPTIESGIESISARLVNQYKPAADESQTVIFINRTKRQVREIVSTLANLNPRTKYTSANEADREKVRILNKRWEHWWASTFADRQIKKALQWAALSVGYIVPRWKMNPYNPGHAECMLDVLGPLDVLPDQLPADNDLQRAYAVHLRFTEPLSQVQNEWWLQRLKIRPDRAGAPVPSSGDTASRRWFGRSLIYRLFGGGDLASNAETNGVTTAPEVDLYYTYINDPSLNESGMELHSDQFTMTDNEHKTVGTTWEYTVPPLGSQIPTGRMIAGYEPQLGVDQQAQDVVNTTATLTPETRMAGRQDAKMYPLRRLIIWCRSAVLYDGPSHYLHGMVPAIPFRMDEWPWDYLGYSVVHEAITGQTAVNTLLSNAVQTQKVRLNPPITYNENEYAKSTMDRVSFMLPGTKIGKTGMLANPIAPVLPYQHYDLSASLPQIIEQLLQLMDYQVGVQDFTALAKLGQMPSADAMEKMMQAIGPLISDAARNMERSLTLLGVQWMWNIFQFDNAKRRISLFGKSGTVDEDFDYDPGVFVPGDVPGVPPKSSFMRKALVWGKAFTFAVAPNSAFDITDMQQKLLYMQLWRDPKNFPLGPWTFGKMMGIDIGPAPDGAVTELEQFMAWQELLSKFQVKQQIDAQQMMTQAQIEMQVQMALAQNPLIAALSAATGQGMGQPPQNPTPGLTQGASSQPGRPASLNNSPGIEQKNDLSGNGPRSTLTT